MNLTPEQRTTIALLFMAYLVEDAITQVVGVRPPWWASVAAVVFPSNEP